MFNWFIQNYNRIFSFQAKLVEDGLDKKVERRPYLATECDDVKEAEKWRIQVFILNYHVFII